MWVVASHSLFKTAQQSLFSHCMSFLHFEGTFHANSVDLIACRDPLLKPRVRSQSTSYAVQMPRQRCKARRVLAFVLDEVGASQSSVKTSIVSALSNRTVF
jgi:hypothetical protein